MSTAYYNEFDPGAAAWLRELIKEKLIAPGVVDERSIADVTPGDLAGFTQCHFFAGIGGWSYALRLAGVPDSRRVWTGSAPCQPFSSAGEGAGFDDERHLWPALHHHARVGRPAEILGEQVASSLVDPWIDLVQADLEALGYAVGSVAFPSAGIGAPHIRDRCYWAGRLGDADLPRLEGLGSRYQAALGQWQGAAGSAAQASELVRLAHADALRQRPGAGAGLHHQEPHAEPWRGADGLAHAARGGRLEGRGPDSGHAARDGSADHGQLGGWDRRAGPGPTNGYWEAADWLACRDSRWRPVEPGTQPLAHGLPRSLGSCGAGVAGLARVAGLDAASLGRAKSYRVTALRGYGNAINVYAAKAFIEAFYGVSE